MFTKQGMENQVPLQPHKSTRWEKLTLPACFNQARNERLVLCLVLPIPTARDIEALLLDSAGWEHSMEDKSGLCLALLKPEGGGGLFFFLWCKVNTAKKGFCC